MFMNIFKNKFYIGIDLGGTTAKFALFDNKDNIIKKWSIPSNIYKKDSMNGLINAICKSIVDELYSLNINLNNLKGIGIGVPGPVLEYKYVVKAVNLNWKKKFDLSLEIKKRLGKKVKVIVNNDANVAALGEYHFGNGKSHNSICLLIMGTGFGSGIVINGKILSGENGAAGEVGHLQVDFSNKAHKCNCGNKGCLETVGSGTGLVNVYNTYCAKKKDKKITAKIICEKAYKNDKSCLKAIELSMSYVADMILVLNKVLDVSCFLISGGLSGGGNIIIKYIEKRFKERNVKNWIKPKILFSRLKNDAGIYGAFALVKYHD